MELTYEYKWILQPMFETRNRRFVSGRVKAVNRAQALERLFELMNTGNQPDGFRSMSVGDTVTLTNDGIPLTWLCESRGWTCIGSFA